MPRVAVVFEYPTIHGGENSFLATCDLIGDNGFEFVALAPDQGDLARALSDHNIPIHPWHVFEPNGTRRSQAELRELLKESIRQLHVDAVHANSLSMSRLSGPVAKEMQVPSLGHLRDIIRLSRQAVSDLNCNNRLLAVSEATRSWHIQQGLDEDNTRVCYNGVDTSLFRPRLPTGYLHQHLNVPPSRRIVGAIGQLGIRKGLDIFLQVADRLTETFQDLHFVIVGQRYSRKAESIEYCEQIYRQAESLALDGRVHFLGRRNDVAHLLNEMTLLIHAARQEPFGRVLLEAAASGTAIVATDVGGTREVLGEGHEILLAPPNDVARLVASASRLLADATFRTNLTSRLREQVAGRLSVDSAAQALASHYWDLV